MGMVVNTNIAAANAYRNLSNTQTNLNKSLEKLSSGLRINRAADDAAGLAISEGLRSQVNGLGVAANNAQDGINVVQTAEGGLNQTHAILQRLRDLAVQAGNDSNNADSRAGHQDRSRRPGVRARPHWRRHQLQRHQPAQRQGRRRRGRQAELPDRCRRRRQQPDHRRPGRGQCQRRSPTRCSRLRAAGQEFDFTAFDRQYGAPTIAASSYTFSVAPTARPPRASPLPRAPSDQRDATCCQAQRADASFSSNFSATVAKNADGSTKGIIVTRQGRRHRCSATVAGDQTAGRPADGHAGRPPLRTSTSPARLAPRTPSPCWTPKIKDVSTARAALGASQNRLESAVQTIGVAKENLTASESRIRDVDMADEMSKYTRSNILSQAGTAMLAQANQSTQGVLSLLR